MNIVDKLNELINWMNDYSLNLVSNRIKANLIEYGQTNNEKKEYLELSPKAASVLIYQATDRYHE